MDCEVTENTTEESKGDEKREKRKEDGVAFIRIDLLVFIVAACGLLCLII